MFMRGCLVHSCAPWDTLGASVVIGFARVRSWGSWVHPEALDSLAPPWGLLVVSLGSLARP